MMKALQRDPKERWQTARDMGRALRQFLGTRQEVIGPAELSEWMSEVFPQGEARKSQLMEVARMGHEAVPAMPRAGEADVTMTATDVMLEEAPALPLPPWRSKRTLALLAAISMLAIGGVLTIAMGGSEVDGDAEVSGSAQAEVRNIAIAGDTASTTETATADGSQPDETAAEPTSPGQARAKPPVKRGPGTINLVTRGGWAEIYEGRKKLGSTPSRLTLPAGRHRLVLKPFGEGKPKTVFVTVEAGKTKNVSIRLE
jgi:hypothetical protein